MTNLPRHLPLFKGARVVPDLAAVCGHELVSCLPLHLVYTRFVMNSEYGLKKLVGGRNLEVILVHRLVMVYLPYFRPLFSAGAM